ncbi:MAG: GMP synthase [Bacteroidetes bacterium]|nr:MAG: GMP synthase [Bacteroidota bacterium]
MALQAAILNMYNGIPNQGMRCIRELLDQYRQEIRWDEFDVRQKCEVPDYSDYDIYISSGGPGNPLEGDGKWDKAYYELLDQIWAHNQDPEQRRKKYVFFICHSFQMACHHFGLAEISRRKSASFGVLPVHKTELGKHDPLLLGLPDPFHVVESRDWQVIQPRLEVFEEHGAHIVSLEKIRDHVSFERAIMAVRFSFEVFGTQFHPEADAEGMLQHFSQPEKRLQVVENYGETKYQQMIDGLKDKDKISLTHRTIIPNFLRFAIKQLEKTG